MRQGEAGNDIAVEANQTITDWIETQAKSLKESGKDRTSWPDSIRPAPNPTLCLAH